MKIQRYGTVGDIEELIAVRDSIERLADSHAGTAAPLVRADLYDANEAFLVRVEVPGVAQGDIEVAVQGEELLVAGIRDAAPEDLQPVFIERAFGPFQRIVALPGPVDPERTTAHLHNGVLTVNLPKLL